MEKAVGNQLPRTLTLAYTDHLKAFASEIIDVAKEARLHHKMENLLLKVVIIINNYFWV